MKFVSLSTEADQYDLADGSAFQALFWNNCYQPLYAERGKKFELLTSNSQT